MDVTPNWTERTLFSYLTSQNLSLKQSTKPMTGPGSCQKQAKDRMKNSASLEDAIQWMEDLTSCVEKDLTGELVVHNKEISLQARTRLEIAGELEN